MVVAGTEDAVLMVESEAAELSEEVMLGAVVFGHEAMKPVIKAIQAFAEAGGNAAWDWTAPSKNEALQKQVETIAAEEISAAYLMKDKTARYTKLAKIRERVLTALATEADETMTSEAVGACFASFEKNLVRQRILEGEPRIDGRDRQTVRPITIRTGLLDRAHGSVLFTRGETQAIVAATLGNDRDAQILDKLDGEIRDRFMLHYNFPPYSVGETGMMGLTATLTVVAFLSDSVAVLPIIGSLLVLESGSVIVQLLSKKFRKKKILLAAPIHHHFEALGWPHYKVTMRFWIIGVVSAIVGVAIRLLG